MRSSRLPAKGSTPCQRSTAFEASDQTDPRCQQPDALGSVIPPVYQTVPFEHEYDRHGFEYSRSANPTRRILETVIAESEGGKHGLVFASGVAAITAVLNCCTVAGILL
jgi:cystathionine beta-lyase/cystathionine gamma-synthase